MSAKISFSRRYSRKTCVNVVVDYADTHVHCVSVVVDYADIVSVYSC